MKRFSLLMFSRRSLLWVCGSAVLVMALWLLLRSPQGVADSPDVTLPAGASPTARDAMLSDMGGPGSVSQSDSRQGEEVYEAVFDAPASLSRAAQKRTVLTGSGVRKELIDPMASWEDQPPWPEGLRLYAEVETAGKRFVNLRPDDVGEMPTVDARAKEEIEITLSIPEADPGEKLYLEMPNGGRFPDQEAVGRMAHLSPQRTLTFKVLADDARGYCNVKIIHRGQTRSLPIWVGAHHP